jgi:hypothetical protein
MIDGTRREAERTGQRGTSPGCDGIVRSNVGEIKVPYPQALVPSARPPHLKARARANANELLGVHRHGSPRMLALHEVIERIVA